jgi:hypothetical protein
VKSNDTSKGEVIANITSVVLNNLLPYSWYDVTVAAYTVKKGTDARQTGYTLETGNLYNLCIIHRGRKKDIQFISFLVWMSETVCVCLQLRNKNGNVM